MLLHFPQFLSYRGVESMIDSVLNDVTYGPADGCGTFVCLPSFFGGVLLLAVVEFFLLVYVVSRLLKSKPHPGPVSKVEIEENGGSITFNLEGDLWVAPVPFPEGEWSKASIKIPGKEKKKEKDGQKEGAKKGGSARETLEITPKRMHVTLKDKVLILKAADGTEEESISLEGCEVVSVASGPGPNSKWGKKFPIKLHHRSRNVYKDCKNCLFYTESGYEKEAWCEVLRAAARGGSQSNKWFLDIKKEFKDYTLGVETHTPYMDKFYSSRGANHFDVNQKDEKSDDHKNLEDGLSKRKLIWKKLTRRNSKGKDKKDTKTPNALDEIGNFTKRLSLLTHGKDEGSATKGKESAIINEHDDVNNVSNASDSSGTSSGVMVPNEGAATDSEEDKITANLGPENDNNYPAEMPDVEVKTQDHDQERPAKELDQGLRCLNMIVTRLYFDFYHSPTRVDYIQQLFQRLMSKVKTPSYIKAITINELKLGDYPPFATAIRMLPSDAGGALALEIDLEWHGKGFITCETRIDVRDQSAQEKVASQLAEPGSPGAAAAAILSGIGGDLETASSIQNRPRSGDEGSKRGWMQSAKSMMSRVAEQVSQVPLLLKIRLVSLKGTMLIRLRAPPSDRIWFAFKEPPEIDLEPEPCIGDHKISSGPLGALIANQLTVQIRESLVMPYCEDLFVHWMLGERDDWLPQSVVPLPFHSLQTEQQNSKQNNHKNGDESSSKNGHPALTHSQSTLNGQNKSTNLHPQKSLPGPTKPPQGPPSSTTIGPAKSQTGLPPLQQNPHPELPKSQPHVSHSQSSVHVSNSTNIQPQRSASSFQLNSEVSRPLGGITGSTLSIREDTESDLRRPLLDGDEYSKEKTVGSSRESDAGMSNRVVDAQLMDFQHQSEGSASENDQHYSSSQVAHQEPAKDVDPNPRVSRRTKMLSLGKMVGSRLQTTVMERIRERKPDGGEGSAHSQARG